MIGIVGFAIVLTRYVIVITVVSGSCVFGTLCQHILDISAVLLNVIEKKSQVSY